LCVFTNFHIFVLLLVTKQVVVMKVVKELEVLVIEECEFDNEVFCDVISSVVGMSMEVGMSKKDVIKVLVDNKVIKEENGGYVLLNFDNYDYDKMEDWWDNDIYDLLSGYRI